MMKRMLSKLRHAGLAATILAAACAASAGEVCYCFKYLDVDPMCSGCVGWDCDYGCVGNALICTRSDVVDCAEGNSGRLLYFEDERCWFIYDCWWNLEYQTCVPSGVATFSFEIQTQVNLGEQCPDPS